MFLSSFYETANLLIYIALNLRISSYKSQTLSLKRIFVSSSVSIDIHNVSPLTKSPTFHALLLRSNRTNDKAKETHTHDFLFSVIRRILQVVSIHCDFQYFKNVCTKQVCKP